MGLFAQIEPATLLLLVVVVLSISLLLWRSHRYLARQEKGWSPPGSTPRQKPPPPGLPLNPPDELARWEVRMHETARELSGQLDSKMGALGQLVREAERAAARLEAALKAVSQSADPPSSAAAIREPVAESRDSFDPLDTQPANQADALKRPEGEPRHAAGPGVAEQEPRPQPAPADRYDEIYLLADYGFDTAEIARRVGSPVGEVELILGLREKR
jgi:hypothetical protein